MAATDLIIDETYFVDNITLPTDNDNYTNKLDRYILKAQKKYLQMALGYELYALFIAELPTPTTTRYVEIYSGAAFTNERTGLADYWDGLSNTELESFLAYFTYVDFVAGNQESESSNGTTANLFENSNRVAPLTKQLEAHKQGLLQYNKLCDFLTANSDSYTEWEFTPIESTNFLNA